MHLINFELTHGNPSAVRGAVRYSTLDFTSCLVTLEGWENSCPFGSCQARQTSDFTDRQHSEAARRVVMSSCL